MMGHKICFTVKRYYYSKIIPVTPSYLEHFCYKLISSDCHTWEINSWNHNKSHEDRHFISSPGYILSNNRHLTVDRLSLLFKLKGFLEISDLHQYFVLRN